MKTFVSHFTKSWRLTLICALALFLTACFEEEKVAISYLAVNHTEHYIASISINGEGGILNVYPMGGGGKIVCCVTLPKKWRPDLKVTVKWQEDGHWQRDDKGHFVLNNTGDKIFIEGPWKAQTISVPQYPAEKMGWFHIHFMPNDQVMVKLSMYSPTHPDYQPPYPKQKTESKP